VDTAKARIEAAAAELLARRGYEGMGMKSLSDTSQAVYGSIYHHFPGGKEEIAVRAVHLAGEQISPLLEAVFAPDADTKGALEAMFAFMADRLAAGEWTLGCPVGTPALDGGATSEKVLQACSEVLAGWERIIAAHLRAKGHTGARSDALAATVLATYEGATVMARAHRDAAVLQAAGRAMVELCTRVPDPGP